MSAPCKPLRWRSMMRWRWRCRTWPNSLLYCYVDGAPLVRGEQVPAEPLSGKGSQRSRRSCCRSGGGAAAACHGYEDIKRALTR
jgi:hypothetical protein